MLISYILSSFSLLIVEDRPITATPNQIVVTTATGSAAPCGVRVDENDGEQSEKVIDGGCGDGGVEDNGGDGDGNRPRSAGNKKPRPY